MFLLAYSRGQVNVFVASQLAEWPHRIQVLGPGPRYQITVFLIGNNQQNSAKNVPVKKRDGCKKAKRYGPTDRWTELVVGLRARD